jgi:hypothetical protein
MPKSATAHAPTLRHQPPSKLMNVKVPAAALERIERVAAHLNASKTDVLIAILNDSLGSVLEWDEDGERIVVRRPGRYSSEEIHRQLFPEAPKPRSIGELKEGIRRHMRKRHARG